MYASVKAIDYFAYQSRPEQMPFEETSTHAWLVLKFTLIFGILWGKVKMQSLASLLAKASHVTSLTTISLLLFHPSYHEHQFSF